MGDGNKLLAGILNNTHMLLACLDCEFNFIVVNRAYAEADNRTPDYFPGRNHFDLFPNEENHAIFRAVVASGQPYFAYAKPFEYAGRPERGVTFWDWSLFPVADSAGKIAFLVLTLANVTQTKAAEEALRRSEERFRVALERSPISVYHNDLDLRYTWIYKSWAGFTHIDIIGKKDDEILPFDAVSELIAFKRQVLLKAAGDRRQIAIVVKDQQRVFDTTGEPLRNSKGEVVGLAVVTTDITDIRRAEEALRQAQRVESIARLVGGVAHRFNNLLTGILGNTSLALQSLSGHASCGYIERAITAAEQAADLTKQLVAYTGKPASIIGWVDLSSLIRAIAPLLQTLIPATIVMELDLQQRLPRIKADEGQMRQVIVNLILNAAEAMDAAPGKVSIRTRLRRIEQAETKQVAQTLADGEYVFLEVHDSGCGISAEIKENIFDPFFTTKFTGRGLGLAAVYGIVKAHRGAIQVQSKPGEGSSFFILFPTEEIDQASPYEQGHA